MEEIIKDLERAIKYMEESDKDMDANDWSLSGEQGITITGNQAKQIVEALKKRKIVLTCNKCGLATIEIAQGTQFIPCCTMPIEGRTSGICGGQFILKA